MADILEWKASHDIRYVEPITPLVLADIYDRAADFLLRDGWTRARLYADDGSMCSSGALVTALGGVGVVNTDGWAQVAYRRAYEMVVKRSPRVAEYGSLPYWNDSACQSGAEAIAMFRDLARTLREEAGGA